MWLGRKVPQAAVLEGKAFKREEWIWLGGWAGGYHGDDVMALAGKLFGVRYHRDE
jgi:hypothetical protein